MIPPRMTWERIMDAARDAAIIGADRRRHLIRSRILATLAILLLLAGLMVAVCPFMLRATADARLGTVSGGFASMAASYPYTSRESMLDEAREYNRRLLKSGQPVLGDELDPDTGETGDFSGSDDPEYLRLLDVDGTGVMARIRIPLIGVDLTVSHGASDETLAHGAGHLHGSSLPVGGVGSRTVITGHSNYGESSLFTRLDELSEGDPFYLDVLGETLAYRVTDIRRVGPEDTDVLRIVSDRDLATLVTCTGQGNTKRLIVTGERADMPLQAPYPEDAPRDPSHALFAAGGAGTATLAAGLPATGMLRRRSRRTRNGAHARA